jgi:exoribonuclease II
LTGTKFEEEIFMKRIFNNKWALIIAVVSFVAFLTAVSVIIRRASNRAFLKAVI